jgi:CheY-like chemotaxis protein
MPDILCIDDEPGILEILQFDLEEAGYQVTIASSVADALRLLSTHKFDYVISDVRMPGRDGRSLVETMRAGGDKTGLAFLSGYSDVTPDFMQRYAVDAVLVKPYVVAQLVEHLKKYLPSK